MKMKLMRAGLLSAALLLLAGMPVRAQEPVNVPAAQAAQVASEGQPTAQVAEAGEHNDAKHADDSGKLHVFPEMPEFIITIIIFGVLLVILRGAAWKPIMKGLTSRENMIREGVEAAAQARADAERTTRELQAKLVEAQAAAAQQIQQARADAQKLAEGIRGQAEAEATAMKDRALRDIAAAKQQAITQINAHAADLATAVASKILQRKITVEDQDRLVSHSLSEMESSGEALATR